MDIRRSSAMYKRAMVPKEHADSTDVEDNAELLSKSLSSSGPHFNKFILLLWNVLMISLELLLSDMDQYPASPPWKLSLPYVLVATVVPFLFGYHLGVVNEPLESISIDLGFQGNTLQEGLVVSTLLAGAFVGSLISGWIADGVGRRRVFQLCALPMLIGGATCATARSLTGMFLGRFLVGTGLGVGPPVVSLYVIEISPAQVRGTYGSFLQIATCFGLVGALLVGIPVRSIFGWWRICFWISTILAALLALLMQGRHNEAEIALEKLLGLPHAKAAMVELLKTDRGDEGDTVKFVELLFGRHSRVVFIGSTLFALQQLSGINAVFYFSSTVFRRTGVSSNLANVFVGIANFIGSIIALALMDKLGRKDLLLWSFFGMAVSTSLQVLSSSVSNTIELYLSVGGMMLFVLMFPVGAGPVPGLLLPEIFPSRIRAKALTLSMTVHWVFNFLVGLLFLRLLDAMGPQLLYSMFATFCMLGAVFVKRNVVETKGKSLQEIEIALLAHD